MSEAQRIEDQLRRGFEGEAWHGPSLKEILADISSAQASARPLVEAHTIWEITLHITAWKRVAGHSYSIYGLLHGVIQHDLYHAGQIALLKKQV